MSSDQTASPCLTPVIAGLFRANAGQISLTLTDTAGNTDFDTQNCKVQDISVNPEVQVPNDTLTAKKWSFTVAANKRYRVQLVVAQNPAIGSKADLAACNVKLMVIDDT